MKIQGPGRTGGTKGVSKTGGSKKTGDASFDSLVGEGGNVDLAHNVSGGSSVTSVSALIAAQEVPDPSHESKRKARQRAGLILDQLDQLKLALLEGRLPRHIIEDLARMIKNQRATITDSGLTEILDEIDLRAQVELAKYEQEI